MTIDDVAASLGQTRATKRPARTVTENRHLLQTCPLSRAPKTNPAKRGRCRISIPPAATYAGAKQINGLNSQQISN